MNKTEPVIESKYQDRAIRALQPLASGAGNDSKFQELVERVAKEIEKAVSEEREANAETCNKAAEYITENAQDYEQRHRKLSQRDLAIARMGYETAKALAKEIRERDPEGFGTAKPLM